MKKEEEKKLIEDKMNAEQISIVSNRFEIVRKEGDATVKYDKGGLAPAVETDLMKDYVRPPERSFLTSVNTMDLPANSNLSMLIKNRLWRNKDIAHITM